MSSVIWLTIQADDCYVVVDAGGGTVVSTVIFMTWRTFLTTLGSDELPIDIYCTDSLGGIDSW
jgi:hypothetical protein